MKIFGNFFAIKALTIDDDGTIKEVRLLPDSLVVAPWFYNDEQSRDSVFCTREEAIESLMNDLRFIQQKEDK